MNGFVKRLTLAVSAAAFAASLGMAGTAKAGGMPESDEPIRLAMNEWTGQHISTHVAGEVLKMMGYNVEYVTAGYYPQMAALRDGTVTATMELWSSNIGDHYTDALASGKVVEIGDLGLDAIETWYVPDFVLEMCPGLPDYMALYDCAELFATPDTFPNGRFVDYPPDWGDSNSKRIEALELPFTSIPSGSEGALIAEIKASYASKTPLILQFWEPQWAQAAYPMTRVLLPPHEDACYDDASWGVNPDMTYDCNWKPGRVFKMAWVGTEEKWPGAFALLQNLQLSNADQNAMMQAIDVDGRDLDEVVHEWLDNNSYKWQVWVGAAGVAASK